ncbi:MAG TPA: hypothetical protein VMG34_08370 [Bacteroidota bacterium]|nr:hypothetical protein [Bacteroidota bacterium]
MNAALALAEFHIPSFLKRRELRRLFTVTAKAFHCEVPSLGSLSYTQTLDLFAQFAERESQAALEEGKDLNAIGERLYAGAHELGGKMRRKLRVGTMNEAMRAARLLYSVIGINFLGTPRGEVTINRCFFGERFSPVTCRIISALDAGMMSGLTQGGTFTFTRRMTEGAETCMAYLIPPGRPYE